MPTKAKKQDPPDLAKLFSKRFRQLLEARGMTADDLVRSSRRYKSGTVASWNCGSRFPKPRSLVDLSETFGVSATELLDGLPVPALTMAEVAAIEKENHAHTRAASFPS